MTHLLPECYFLPDVTAESLSAIDFGKLRARLDPPSDPASFTILDCFDRSLRDAGTVLIATPKKLTVFTETGSQYQSLRYMPGFVVDLPDGPVKEQLTDVSPLRSLVAMGQGEISLASIALVDDEEKTRAKADLVYLSSGGKGVIITLKGLRGYDKALATLRQAITDANARPLTQADLYRSLFPDLPDYVAKPAVTIGYDEPACDVASHIMAAYIPVARANEPGVIADIDTEFLHDYRIALRKIRSVISLFKGVYGDARTLELKTRFSELMAQTGRLRDLDVYLLEKDSYYDLLPPSLHDGLDQMFDLFTAEREACRKALAKHLKSKAYEAEITDLAKLLNKPKKLGRGPNADLPAHDYACALIWKRYRKICKITAGIGPDTDDEEVHELRIHCKKLRYLMEFFGPVFPKKEFKSILKPLKKLQDNLGYFNDYSVQQDSLRDFLDGLNGKNQMQIAQSVGALIATLHKRQLEERAKVVDSFATFNSAETQAIFCSLFHDRKDSQ